MTDASVRTAAEGRGDGNARAPAGTFTQFDVFSVAGMRYEWTPWVDLGSAFLEPSLPIEPGLYRIRRVSDAGLDYIGQTGVGIRSRVRMLRGIRNEEMPYRDPHTAAPALWALLKTTECEFEVSSVPLDAEDAWRKGFEAVAIALYRQETGQSPSVNFGRMPPGFRMSSGNNARLVAAGRRFRGGATSESNASHVSGVAPVSGLDGDSQEALWCGHDWSSWVPSSDYRVAAGRGLYRIRSRQDDGLTYIGEGQIDRRLGAHLRKGRPTATMTAQATILARTVEPEFSYVTGEWEVHQRLELETDLIAAHVLRHGRPPIAQFIG